MSDLGDILEAKLEAIVDRVLSRKLNAQASATPALLDRRGIAKALGVHPDTVDKWRKLGMPCRTIPGSAPRFLLDECVEWVRGQRSA